MNNENYVLKSTVRFEEVKALLSDEDAAIIKEALAINEAAIISASYAISNQATKIKMADRSFEIIVWGDKKAGLKGFIVYRYNNSFAGKLFKAAVNAERNRTDKRNKVDAVITHSYPDNEDMVTFSYTHSGKVTSVRTPYSEYVLKQFDKRHTIFSVK